MAETGSSEAPVVVVGAGLVGLCTALSLQRDGREVLLIDRDGPGEGASFGNAGVFSVGSVQPLGMPGMLAQVPGMLLDPLGPLTIRLSYALSIAPWLISLLRHSTPARVEAISKALGTITKPCLEYYQPLIDEAGAGHLVGHVGCLYIAETDKEWAGQQPNLELRRRRGVAIEDLTADELRQLQPAMSPHVKHAALAPHAGHSTNPLAMSQAFAALFRAHGGVVLREQVVGFDIGADGPCAVKTTAASHPASAVVIAAGAFSRALARQLGSDAPLDTERGYHVMLPEPQVDVRMPMLCAGGFAVTPMAEGLRIAGTVEFGGLKAPPNYKRADVLLRHARRLFPGVSTENHEQWMGFRPSMPDSLPVISRSPRHRNVFFAFGHGHLGLTLGAVTGGLIADLVAGRTPAIDVAPFRIDRF